MDWEPSGNALVPHVTYSSYTHRKGRINASSFPFILQFLNESVLWKALKITIMVSIVVFVVSESL